MAITCPLCNSGKDHLQAISGPLRRIYYQCSHCHLIFVSPGGLPSKGEEKSRYLEHNNSGNSDGYVNFLNKAVQPALPYLKAGMRGLDFGSGPCPVLSKILKAKEIECFNYDPFFEPSLVAGTFDFIFSTETFEHFHNPQEEITRISNLLNAGGILTVMTMFHNGAGRFKDWFYARDITHVGFYDLHSFNYICQKWDFELLWDDGERVVVLRKSC